jgi:A/G-specific adenine glycosylase
MAHTYVCVSHTQDSQRLPGSLLKSTEFSERLLQWFDQHGRHDLPWQHPRSPYFVWLSEVMLQQTQVNTVKDYFQRFVARFPTLAALAKADLDEVLTLWAGLGYYSRARNLHACAQQCLARHGGDLPDNFDDLIALPGIGRSTAGAILAQAFGQRAAILDGNVKRVLARLDAIRTWPGTPETERALWQRAQTLLPLTKMPQYSQAIMDFGATLCTARLPKCEQCPISDLCQALALGLTQELPVKRSKKPSPTRHSFWLLARDVDGRVLLQRRPELGIWGGLYSLPEADDSADFSAQNLPLTKLVLGQELATVRHVFTHFNLVARPILARAAEKQGLQGPGWVWVDRDNLRAFGMPAPVAKLLAGLFES